MAAIVRQTVIEFSTKDRELLDRLAEHLDCSRIQVLRWALRSYAIEGAWAVSIAERESVCEGLGPLDCGPSRRVTG